MKNLKKLLIILTIFIIFSIIALGYFGAKQQSFKTKANHNLENSYVPRQVNSFSYKGEEGIDALSILKNKTNIEQASSGLVISINGRKADEKKREFWAFYINGKSAEVGPASYITKKGDLIEWKIENY